MIKPDEQLTAYDSASKQIEEAAKILAVINVARLNAYDADRLANLIHEARVLRAQFYQEAHDCFRRERGFDLNKP